MSGIDRDIIGLLVIIIPHFWPSDTRNNFFVTTHCTVVHCTFWPSNMIIYCDIEKFSYRHAYTKAVHYMKKIHHGHKHQLLYSNIHLSRSIRHIYTCTYKFSFTTILLRVRIILDVLHIICYTHHYTHIEFSFIPCNFFYNHKVLIL